MQGGGIKASANMWALLADEDPGDSSVAKRARDEIEATSVVPDGNKERSSSVDDKKRKRKRKRNKKPSKQHKEAAASGNSGESEDSDEDEEATAAGASCFRALFQTVVTMALITFCYHASSAFAAQ